MGPFGVYEEDDLDEIMDRVYGGFDYPGWDEDGWDEEYDPDDDDDDDF